MRRHPDLYEVGIGRAWNDRRPVAEYRAELRQSRARLAEAVQECTDAEEWLRGARRTIRKNRRRGSVGLKHDMYRVTERYVTNGAFILAAIHLGFEFERCGLNVRLNISEAWRQGQLREARATAGS